MNSKMNLYFIQTKRIKPGEYINFYWLFRRNKNLELNIMVLKKIIFQLYIIKEKDNWLRNTKLIGVVLLIQNYGEICKKLKLKKNFID